MLLRCSIRTKAYGATLLLALPRPMPAATAYAYAATLPDTNVTWYSNGYSGTDLTLWYKTCVRTDLTLSCYAVPVQT